MAGEEYDISFFRMFFHALLHLENTFGIETGERLVQDPEFRIVHKGGHDGDLLFHAVTVSPDLIVESVRQIKPLHIFVDPFRAVFFGNVIEIGNVIDVFSPRQVFVKGVVIGHESRLQFRADGLLFHVVSANFDLAARDRLDPYDAFDDRAFSRAVRSQKPEDRSALDFEIGVAHGVNVARGVFFRKVS